MEQPEKGSFDFSNAAKPEDVEKLANDGEEAAKSHSEIANKESGSDEEFHRKRKTVQELGRLWEPYSEVAEGEHNAAKLLDEVHKKENEEKFHRKAVQELRDRYEPHSEIANRESGSDEILDELHKKEKVQQSDFRKSLNELRQTYVPHLTERISETNEAGDSGAIAQDRKIENQTEREDAKTDMQIVLGEIYDKLEKNAPLDRSERVILQLLVANAMGEKSVQQRESSEIQSAGKSVQQQENSEIQIVTRQTKDVRQQANKETATRQLENGEAQEVVRPANAVVDGVATPIAEATNQNSTVNTQAQEIHSPQPEKKGGFRDWLKRNKTRIAVMAGGLATGAVTALNHIPYVATGAMVLGAASGLSSRLLSYLYEKDLEKLRATTDENARKILAEKIRGKEKKMKILGYVGTFLGGVAAGNFAANFIASRIPKGPTSTTANPEAGNSTPTEVQSTEAQPEITAPASTNVPAEQVSNAQATTTVPTETVNVPTATPEVSGNGVLVSNGRVNLPGSAWNGNLARNATGGLQGGELNYSNYAGGWHEMAPKMLENDLIAAGINRDTLLGNLNTGEIHRLLNGYLTDIQNGAQGATNPDLLTNLGKLGTQGAQNLINIIQGR